MTQTLTAPRHEARLKMRHIPGYGSDAESIHRLERAFGSSNANDIPTLCVTTEKASGRPQLTGLRFTTFTADSGVSSCVLRGVDGFRRDALGGVFLTYFDDKRMVAGPFDISTPKPVYYLTSHGVVILQSNLLVGRLDENFLADRLSETTLLLCGRSGSNHERLIFTKQAISIVERLIAMHSYRNLDLRVARVQAGQ